MQQRGAHAFLVVIFLASPGMETASAHDASEGLRACMNEGDDARRLQCYDTEMARQVSGSSTAPAATASSAAGAPLSPEERFGLNDEQARKKQNIDETPAIDRLSATITGLSRRAQGELVITLSNGQVWAQKQAASFEVKVGDAITIKAAALGSFLMSTASGRSTRVTRLQ
jgi:hypothetical protein